MLADNVRERAAQPRLQPNDGFMTLLQHHQKRGPVLSCHKETGDKHKMGKEREKEMKKFTAWSIPNWYSLEKF